MTATIAATASGQRAERTDPPFRLALGLEHGVVASRYVGNLYLQPAYDVGRFRLAVDAGLTYENPDVVGMIGLRPSFALWPSISSSTGIRVVLSASYLTLDAWRVGAGGLVDFELLRVGAIVGRDTHYENVFFVTTLELDLLTLVDYAFVKEGFSLP